jgi:CMP-N,N'-diacetyllegionaminic acid synthase
LLLLRKPLLQWTLEAVRDSSLIDDCVVTSDDPDVLQIAANDPYVFLLNQRPARLARDNTPTEAVMEHVLRQYDCDTIVLLQATSPLREGWHVDEAIRLLHETASDSVVSVVRTHHLLWRTDARDRPHSLYAPASRPRRQDMDQFAENGAIYVCTRAHWDTTHCRLGGKVALYEMSEEHALQIDTALDMELCAAVLARRHGTVPGVRRANRVSR